MKIVKPITKRIRSVVNAFRLGYYPKVSRKAKWLGNDYGGFFVAMDDLPKEAIVYSIGIGKDISFDRAIMQEIDCQVFAFDPTPNSIAWVEKQEMPDNFRFYPLGIGAESGTAHFYLPQNEEFISGSLYANEHLKVEPVAVEIRTIEDLATMGGHQRIHILKMDIEGAEYDVIPQLLAAEVVIDQMLIEFHHRMTPNGWGKTREAIKLLRRAGYTPFAWSDRLEEISFIR